MRTTILSIMAICGSHILYAQGVGINTLKPDPSAALDIVSDSKGLLIPRVDLKSLTDGKTIDKPAHSLLVYNVNGKLPGGEGYYSNAGTKDNPKWVQLAITANVPDKVAFKAAGLLPGQLVPLYSAAKVQFGTEEYDLGNHYDDTGGPQGSFFKAPVKGIYHFDAQLYAHGIGGDGALGNALLIKEKNGVSTTIFLKRMENNLSFSCDVRLEEDDLVYVKLSNDYKANVTLILEWYSGYSASDGFFNGRLVMRE